MKDYKNTRARFEAKYIPEPNTGCWLWTASLTPAGYGQLTVAPGKPGFAHRISWWLHTGEVPPKGIEVCHKCDTPACVNPAHLFLGTHKENMHDMWRKGRLNSARGQRASQAKFSDSTIAEVRRRYTTEIITQSRLAREYGIEASYVSRLVRGLTRTRPDPRDE